MEILYVAAYHTKQKKISVVNGAYSGICKQTHVICWFKMKKPTPPVLQVIKPSMEQP